MCCLLTSASVPAAKKKKKSIETAGIIMPYILMILKIFVLPISESDTYILQV